MSNYTWVIDAGHGGVDKDGKYTTDPKLNKRYKFEDGFEVLEGVINRQIAKRFVNLLLNHGIDVALVYHEIEDWSLTKRKKLADAIHAKTQNTIFVALHSNAGKGKGNELFTSKGLTESDYVASYFAYGYKTYMADFPFRPGTDGLDKEENFTVINTPGRASVLLETLFFDNRKEAEFLMSSEGQDRIANMLFEVVKTIEDKKPVYYHGA